ncbi:proliferation-associated protein 2G4 [Dermatophagoides farinae]|uniref:proliferation-associated protein 2G4 n=1 Tax=Dermatophagoides farinae TaxID=6954 RepID=UPI003F60388A
MSESKDKDSSTITGAVGGGDVEKNTIATDIVVTKYKMAGEMVNRVLQQVLDKCVAGASIIDICEFGDNQINEETKKVFKKEKEIKKGIAFPTCVSVNNCVCHYSPLKSDPIVTLKDGDMVKVDLGAHIDGYMALAAHTIVIGATMENRIKGRQADALLAAYYGSEVALRLVQPGNENIAVTDAVQKVSDTFKCKPISGMLSHQTKQYQMDGGKTIIQNPTDIQRKEHEKCEFLVHEVYAIDVLITTGDGKTREMDSKTTIYRKTDENYQLKMKASRVLFSDIDKKFANMPFTLRALDNEQKARMGVVECVKHKLLEPYSVLYDKDNEMIAQFKFTVLLMPSGSHKITGLSFDPSICESEYSIEDESLKTILAKGLTNKTAKKKKKSKSSSTTTTNAGDGNDDATTTAAAAADAENGGSSSSNK